MPKLARFFPIIGAAVFFGGSALLSFGGADPCAVVPKQQCSTSPTRIPAPDYGYRLKESNYRGATSCAAASCHGGGQPGKTGSEYNTWIEKDPHSRAYRVLFNDKSRYIARKMQFVNKTNEIVPAHQDKLCLKCHALNIEVPDPVLVAAICDDSNSVPSREVFAAQGVNCESCHGGSNNWLTTHYQREFLNLCRQEKAERHGLYPTKDLAFRATLCASCHIGSSHQEVSHDLVAAGHPRLTFEFTSFLTHPDYQPHWTEKAYGKDFEVRAWAIGQVASARAAVGLLKSRAQRCDNSKSPWPELTEYSCFACHKNIEPARSWLPFTETHRSPGAMPWGGSTTQLLELLAHRGELFGFGETPSLEALLELTKMMEEYPANRGHVAYQSEKALGELDQWLRRLQKAANRDSRCRPISLTQIVPLFHDVAGHAFTPDGRKLKNFDSDSAYAYFKSLTVLERAERRQSGKPTPLELSERLADLRLQVENPCGYNSPRDQRPSEILNLFRHLRKTPLSSELRP